MKVDFEAPRMVASEPEVEIQEEDVESELVFRKGGLTLFALGNNLSMNAVKQLMAKVWNFVALPDLYYHEQ